MSQGKQDEPTVLVRQVKSGIGYNERQKATLKAMGLGRLGRLRRLPDNPQVRGMIASVVHLVMIEDAQHPDAALVRGPRLRGSSRRAGGSRPGRASREG